MAQADLAYKTTTGQKLHLTDTFTATLEIQEATGCDIKDARQIAHIANILNEKFGPTITLSDMISWGYNGIPEIALSEYRKHRQAIEEARRQRAAIANERSLRELKHFMNQAFAQYGVRF